MPTTQIECDTPALARIVESFHADGFALVPGACSAVEVAELKHACDAVFADPALRARASRGIPFVAAQLYELEPIFARLAASEPVFGLMERVLGPGFQACGQNVIRNGPGQSISRFHVDDVVEFPLPAGVPRHDSRLRMPVQWLTVQMPLSDIDTEDHGPTQFVPGSHYAGRTPDDEQAPQFEGRGPVSVLCRAGDIYLQNNQCWHRGAPNRSQRTRYVLQTQYACRWAAARFHHPLPSDRRDEILRGADERMRQVLGEANAYSR